MIVETITELKAQLHNTVEGIKITTHDKPSNLLQMRENYLQGQSLD
ncbi:MAG: hypothetical protein ACRCXC_00980 [Legionella sp.]